MDDFLSAQGLCTHYRLSQALFDVSVSVPRHGVVAILGRNGAGKTTLLKTLAGELRQTRGGIRLEGDDIARWSTERRVRRGLAYVPQDKDVFAALTVRENLQLGRMVCASGSDGIERAVALFPRLGQRLNQKAGTLSGGERKMLAISRALLGEPRLLLLDEPTEGVWHGVIEEIAACLRELAQATAILIVEQHIKLALGLATYCYVMDRGSVALEGAARDVQDDPRLERLLAP
jgi:branched-chain amino acid transport system ATP-binding protein